jgi:Domain of unknown function (DUF4129)
MALLPEKKFATERALRGPRPMEILDEAVALLRQAPLAAHVIYYAGALPYCVALIYFVFDMTQAADAEKHLALEAAILTVLYFWMKTCQAVFARRLLAFLEGEDLEPWNAARWANTALLQTVFAGSFFFIYPLAVIIVLPFGWVNAFYHSISIVATGPKSSLRASLMEAFELSNLWPKQNWLVLGVLLAALLFLFINVAVFIGIIPRLLNMFFGLSTIFDESSSAWNNSSFYLDVLVLCFLILNPLNKAIYVLRSFYGRARLNGADLQAELRRQRGSRHDAVPVRALALVLMVATAFSSTPLRADSATPPTVITTANPALPPAPSHLNQAIDKTLSKDEYAWRMPRQEEAMSDDNVVTRILKKFFDYIGSTLTRVMKAFVKFLRWLWRSDKDHDPASKPVTGVSHFPWETLFFCVLVLVVACLILLIVRYFQRRNAPLPVVTPTVPLRTIDLEAEDVRADALPEDSWLSLAQELIEKGELRLALRAFYLATLSILAQKELIRLAAAKSNRDYLQELTRRLRGNLTAVPAFRENVRLFEASWYGTHAVTAAIIDAMRSNHQNVRDHAAA